MRVECAVRTHVGLIREANEDNYVTIPERGVYVVADGMGGHVAGQLASEIAVETVAAYFDGDDDHDLIDMDAFTGLSREALELAEALLLANHRIFERASADRELAGMGTTAVGIRLNGQHIGVSHAGDSRCYLFRSDQLSLVTVDHSLSNFLLALGRDIEARYAEQTMSNVIMRALGLEAEVAIDTKEFLTQPGDRLVLCSDGLSDLVPDEVLADVLSDEDRDLDAIVDELVELALGAGGRDNITVLVLDILGGDEASASFSETMEVPVATVTPDAALDETLLPEETDD